MKANGARLIKARTIRGRRFARGVLIYPLSYYRSFHTYALNHIRSRAQAEGLPSRGSILHSRSVRAFYDGDSAGMNGDCRARCTHVRP
ncbi:MAG: hypothetical protein C4536_10790 [Actinobacteria bacterium]|nr:MAG: hypothetical protein C4536_10790 [Actinomycetota bacterium]